MLHVIGSKTLGGAERFYLRLTEALAEAGENVHAVLRTGSEVVGVVPPSIPVITVPMRAVWDPVSRWMISRLVARMKPDIVQTYMGRATRLTHVPPGRGTVHVARLGGYYKLDGYRHAHAWIGNTQGLCDYMVRGGLPAGRVFHIGNFIDLPPATDAVRIAATRKALGIAPDALVLVTAGRFVPVKGHDDLIAAFARLPRAIRDRPLILLMVGDGPLAGELKRQAEALGVRDRIVWTGWQTDPGPFYDAADLVVFPSLEQETLGNVILEAWAHGKPLVTSAFPGALEITREGEDAVRVPCRDPVALAGAIADVLADERGMAALARAGHARVTRDFSRAAVVGQYRALYDQLLASA
jgi:glycosyltransferase involved in cell wall biosynthesis